MNGQLIYSALVISTKQPHKESYILNHHTCTEYQNYTVKERACGTPYNLHTQCWPQQCIIDPKSELPHECLLCPAESELHQIKC